MAKSKYLICGGSVLWRDSNTQKIYLEGISDFLKNNCVLPEGKHRNCQLIQPFQKFQNKAVSFFTLDFFYSSPITSAFLFSFSLLSHLIFKISRNHVAVSNN